MKKKELQTKFSKITWNKIKDFIPENFHCYETFRCWKDYKGREKKIDIEYLEKFYKNKYGDKAKLKMIYTYCEGSTGRYIKRKNHYLLIVY